MLTERELTAGVSRRALEMITAADAGPLLSYRAQFMCMRVSRGVHDDTEIHLAPMAQPVNIGRGLKRATAGGNISLVIVGDEASAKKFEPGKTYFLYFCEGPEEKPRSNGAAKPAATAIPPKRARA